MAKKTSVVDEARQRLKLARDADGGNRISAMEDLKFAAGEQWPNEIAMARKLDRRPCHVINKTETFVRSTVNNMRQQRPRIQIHPVSDGADEQIAKVLQGLTKHIEVNSNADYAYDTAADFQVRMGWGYIRLATRYVDDNSFDQEIYIDAVKNPFTVYLDPSSSAPDGSDAQWCIVTERMKRKAFEAKWPNAKPVSMSALGGGDDVAEWANNEEIVVADYYRIEEHAETLYLLSTGAKVFESDMPPKDALEFAGIHVVSQRESMRRQVKVSKITAVEELPGSMVDLPGKHIPVVPVYGSELLDNGKVVRYGMVRHIKDPQRMYNYWRSMETEVVALAPKAPWVMAEGQDEGREAEWNAANSKNFSSLKYKPITAEDGSTLLPPPVRQQPQAIPAASVNAAMGASEDMKAVAGMFDPALGAEGNETSGTMVQQRQQQSDMSNFHFYDNLTRSIRWVGKLILDWIPTYYDAERVIRIIGEDNKPSMVTINQQATDKVLNDLTVGTYDVVMETGPGYQTKREQNFAWMMDMGKAWPELFHIAGDLIIRQSDMPGASDLADRMAAQNPVAQAGKDLPEDIDPQVKSMVVQLQAQLAQAQKAVQQLTQEKQAHVFGVQAKGQIDMARDAQEHQLGMERAKFEESHEKHRLSMKELGQDERTRMEIMARLQETMMKDRTSMQETLIDAQTNLAIAHKQALQRGNPDSNRTTK